MIDQLDINIMAMYYVTSFRHDGGLTSGTCHAQSTESQAETSCPFNLAVDSSITL